MGYHSAGLHCFNQINNGKKETDNLIGQFSLIASNWRPKPHMVSVKCCQGVGQGKSQKWGGGQGRGYSCYILLFCFCFNLVCSVVVAFFGVRPDTPAPHKVKKTTTIRQKQDKRKKEKYSKSRHPNPDPESVFY